MDEYALAHFVSLAKRGKNPGCSGGERRAYHIAEILLDQAPGLDSLAVKGLTEYARVASESWMIARELVHGAS